MGVLRPAAMLSAWKAALWRLERYAAWPMDPCLPQQKALWAKTSLLGLADRLPVARFCLSAPTTPSGDGSDSRYQSGVPQLLCPWVVLMDAGLSTTPAEEVPEGGFQDVEVVPVRVVTPQGAPRVQAAPRPAAPAPAPAAAADSWLPPEKGNDGDLGPATGGWESTVVHFGKNKGQTLGQLAPNSLRWYCENFTVKTTKDDGSERPASWVATDTAFRNALDAAQQSMMG